MFAGGTRVRTAGRVVREGSEGMASGPREEKRATLRAALTTFCPAEFTHEGAAHEALMTDLSEAGARFRLQEPGRRCALKRGEELDYRLHTPYGDTVCSGRVIWVRKIDDLWCWGVTFTRVSDQPGDPLRALIEASF